MTLEPSESEQHYIIQIHMFGADERTREYFCDRIIEEAYRYEDDEVFIMAGPCEDGGECHGDEAYDEDDE